MAAIARLTDATGNVLVSRSQTPPAAPTTSTAAHVSIRFTPALSPLGSQLPAVHRPRTDAPVGCHLPHRPTIGDDRQDCLVPLLRHAQLPHARERDKSAEVVVTNQPKVCNASAEGLMRPVSRATGFEPATLGLKVRPDLRSTPSQGSSRIGFSAPRLLTPP